MTSQTSELVERLRHRIELHRSGEDLSGYRVQDAEFPVADVETLLERLSSSEVTEGWLPIESAPKDGTPVLLGYFRENFDGSIYQEGGAPVVAAWIQTKKLADDGATINWVARRERLRSSRSFSPTHWRPLPEPPRSSATSKEQHP